jgi:hypothetical protein
MRRLKKFSFALLGFALAATAAQAGWQDMASAYDAGRLGKLDEAKQKGLSEAEAGASQQDIAIIRGVLDPQPVNVSPGALVGGWRCRTIKLGGMTPDVIYTWFSCRISARGDRLYFQKLSGSQRTNGFLYPDPSGGLVYLGASSVTGEPPHTYSGNGASVGAGATPDDQVGLLVATGPNSARIELPYPVQESTFDVIELRR